MIHQIGPPCRLWLFGVLGLLCHFATSCLGPPPFLDFLVFRGDVPTLDDRFPQKVAKRGKLEKLRDMIRIDTIGAVQKPWQMSPEQRRIQWWRLIS